MQVFQHGGTLTKPLLFDDFASKHKGEIAYVFGNGHSCAFYDPAFFADKLKIGVNYGWEQWLPSVDYAVTKYHDDAEQFAKDDRIGLLVISMGQTGQINDLWAPRSDMLIFPHNDNQTVFFDETDFPERGLVVSYSTITSAMHFAAHIGASAIITVGADCGWIDDKSTVGDYPDSLDKHHNFAHYFELQNRIVATEIRRRYGIPVMSMLPFVTPNMEGHHYHSPFGSLNA